MVSRLLQGLEACRSTDADGFCDGVFNGPHAIAGVLQHHRSLIEIVQILVHEDGFDRGHLQGWSFRGGNSPEATR